VPDGATTLLGLPILTPGDTTVVRLTVDPAVTATYLLGDGHRLMIPAGSICDPALSSYGPEEWNKPCAPLTRGVEITARSYTNFLGKPRVDFEPALRFVPGRGGAVVTLSMLDRQAVLLRTPILYCSTAILCLDEALADLSLGTAFDTRSGYLVRRLKHFSGYAVGVGRSGSGAY